MRTAITVTILAATAIRAAGPIHAQSAPAGTQPTTVSGPTTTTAATTTTAPTTAPAKTDEVAVSFKNMSAEQIGSFLSEKLGRPVLVDESVRAKKLTVISKKKMPLADALTLIRHALLTQGVIVEELPSLARLRPVTEVMQSHLPRVPADRSVTTVKDRAQIVAKEFRIKHYDVGKMVSVLKPMLPSYGHVTADPDTGTIVVTDTVTNLMRIESVINGIDVPLAEGTQTAIIPVQHADAAEIIAIVRWLIAGRMGINVKDITTATGAPAGASKGRSSPGPSRGPRRPGRSPSPSKSSGKGASAAGVTQIEPSKTPVTLVPHVSRNWIIAVAPAEMMAQIKIWVEELDKPREVEKDYELYDVVHADVGDLAQQIERTVQASPNVELRESTHIVPFGQSKKVIVFGSKKGREMVKDLLTRLDVEDASSRTRKTFALKHADAEEMAERIEDLFSRMELSYRYESSYGYS
ncbi:MAG: secretin N-terminal domain-containing protein, partial [Planctomycetota bacterium]